MSECDRIYVPLGESHGFDHELGYLCYNFGGGGLQPPMQPMIYRVSNV